MATTTAKAVHPWRKATLTLRVPAEDDKGPWVVKAEVPAWVGPAFAIVKGDGLVSPWRLYHAPTGGWLRLKAARRRDLIAAVEGALEATDPAAVEALHRYCRSIVSGDSSPGGQSDVEATLGLIRSIRARLDSIKGA